MTGKADRAKEILEDPVVKEAFENLRQYYFERFESLPMVEENIDPQVFMDLRRLLYLLNQIKTDLEKMIQVGNLQDFRVQQEAELEKGIDNAR